MRAAVLSRERPTTLIAQPGWSYEIKWDGWRALALVVGGKVLRLVSRRGVDLLLKRFLEMGELTECVRGDALHDGEIIADAVTLESFNRLLAHDARRTFVVFDVLAIDARSVTGEPLERRAAHGSLARTSTGHRLPFVHTRCGVVP